MNRHVFTVTLKDDPATIEAYRVYHREVWPEVQQSLRRCGMQRMDIYLRGRRLVMIVEMRDGIDYRTAFRSHAVSAPRVAEWEDLMRSLQEPPSEAAPGEWWAEMEPVFHLDHGAAASGLTEVREPASAHVADRARTV